MKFKEGKEKENTGIEKVKAVIGKGEGKMLLFSAVYTRRRRRRRRRRRKTSRDLLLKGLKRKDRCVIRRRRWRNGSE